MNYTKYTNILCDGGRTIGNVAYQLLLLLLLTAGGRYASRNTVSERSTAFTANRSQRGRQRHNLGHGRDVGAPVDIVGEPAGRVASFAQPQRTRPKPAQGCGSAGVLLRP